MTEREIFIEALDKGSPAERAAFLDAACAGDAALRGRVEALLQSHEGAGEFLNGSAPERLAGGPGVGVLGDDTRTGPAALADERLDFLDPSDKPGSIGRLGHYEVQEVVGRGGMGVVLKAFDETLHRVVAIKVMAPQLATSATARKRFVREARAQAAVTHDHVVTIHAVDDAGPLPRIVMQFVAGQSLQDRLDRSGPLPVAEILRIGMQAASGLAAAHAQGLVHRDVKPANILLENGVERVKLTDFGLARAADDTSLTQSGTVAGTPAFMSPEQAEGSPVDHRSDLFSLGSVLYAMCTGRPPFRASTSMGVLKRVCEEIPKSVRETNPEIPDWLAAVVEKLHAKDPAARFQSAADVAEVLGRHLAHVQHPSVVPLTAVAKSAEPSPEPARPERRSRWAVAAAALVAVVAALGTAEATGVTKVRATVIRFFTPDGTLVVETDDPAVKVVVEGDGDLVITGAGPQEVRLRAGSYRLKATKDGLPIKLDRDLVNITRGDRQIVRVRLEGDAAAAAPSAERGAFVLLAAGKERKFDTLAEAVQSASKGDTIEVRGNGPFVSDGLTIANHLVIRAGEGYKPSITLSTASADKNVPLLTSAAPLVLEGLELRRVGGAGVTDSYPFLFSTWERGNLHVANCRIIFEAGASRTGFGFYSVAPVCVLRNCEYLSNSFGCAVVWKCPAGGRGTFENCITAHGGTMAIHMQDKDLADVVIQIRRNTAAGSGPSFGLYRAGQPAKPPVRLDLESNILSSQDALGPNATIIVNQLKLEPTLSEKDAEALLTAFVSLHEQRNVYPDHPRWMQHWVNNRGIQNPEAKPGSALADWNRLWKQRDTGSVEGTVRFEGGDLLNRSINTPEKLTATDFRLRPDSAGYKAGKGDKDLGADVDLVGPGKAYERWKKTPEYQEWLKETGQLKK